MILVLPLQEFVHTGLPKFGWLIGYSVVRGLSGRLSLLISDETILFHIKAGALFRTLASAKLDSLWILPLNLYEFYRS
jgi:hypothetical protein